jgi:hypothetical protein
MANTSLLTSRPRERQLSFRLDSVEKFSTRLVANGSVIKKNKKRGLTKPPTHVIISTERNERN